MSLEDDVVDTLAARHTALEREHAAKTRELAASSQLLEEMRAKRRLPLVDRLRVAAPCTVSWDQMAGDERTRHCGQCNKNVYNVSGLTYDEATALLTDNTGDLCVRYYKRADGTILLADCTIGAGKRRKRRIIAAGAAALLASGVAATLAGVGDSKDRSYAAVSGGISLPVPHETSGYEPMMGGSASSPAPDLVAPPKRGK